MSHLHDSSVALAPHDNDIHTAAVEAGATVLGDPPHYLMTAAELVAFVEVLREQQPLPPIPFPTKLPPPPC